MAKFYEMPAVSPTMELGTIVAWRIEEGATFAPQSVIAEVGTDKANMEAEIFDKGVMLKHLVAVGDEVPPGFPIAIIGDAVGEDIAALVAQFATMPRKAAGPAPAAKADEPAPTPAAAPAPVASATKAAAPAAPKAAEPAPSLDRKWRGKLLRPDVLEPHMDLRYGSGASSPAARVVASPLAKAIAADRGVNLARVKGSGPGGRIVQADVENAGASASSGRTTARRADEVVKLTQMRKTIAKRLLASHQDIPNFFLTVTYDMTAFVGFRDQLKKHLPDVKVSHNDVFIACVARALREYPKANAAWGDGAITRFGRVDIGVAVAIEDGLITPVLRDADQLRFDEIGAKIRELAGRAREQKLKPDEYTGSTFTISNLGMYDIEQFTAIINPPEAAILAVGSISEVPVAKNGALTTGWRMKVTMTCDHRVIDGATGAAFLQVLRRYVEAPMLLLL